MESTEEQVSVVPMDPSVLNDYISHVASVLLDGTDTIILGQLRASRSSMEACEKFADDPGTATLFILKAATSSDADNFEYSAHLDMFSAEMNVAWLAIVKSTSLVTSSSPPTGAVLDGSRPVSQQVQVIQLPAAGGTSACQTLHSYIHSVVNPFFLAHVVNKGKNSFESETDFRDEKDSKMLAKKKIAELELTLLQLQQNFDIPDVSLSINPVIASAVQNAVGSGRRPNVEDLGDYVNDSAFLNKLQSDVNNWIREIQKVTKLNRDPSTGSANLEVRFWLDMERHLEKIETQLKSDGIQFTLDVLKSAKRFHATMSFLADTGIKESMEVVQKYNILMKDFPISDLLSAPDLSKLNQALIVVFTHVNKKLKLSPYPIKRALAFIDALSRDLTEQVVRILSSKKLMHMASVDAQSLLQSCEEIFQTWDEQTKEFTNIARDLTRKRGEKFIAIKLTASHLLIRERLQYIGQFRARHDQLRETIFNVFIRSKSTASSGKNLDTDAVEEIDYAFAAVRSVHILDTSTEGTDAWISAEQVYNSKISIVENKLIMYLKDQLSSVKNASEMFRVFSKFNSLFVRPKIRGAIQEYQTQLLESVKEDIIRLQEIFKVPYINSETYRMNQLRDIPLVSGTIMWTRQLDRQLSILLKRVEDVLGKGWEQLVEGQKLHADSHALRLKLDPKPIFDKWLSDMQSRNISISGPIFSIVRNRYHGNEKQLNVNFDQHTITLFKEVRNLSSMGFHIPHVILTAAKDARRVYPFAVALDSAVRTYQKIISMLKGHEDGISLLIARHLNEIRELIKKGMSYRWDFFVQAYAAVDAPESFTQQHVAFVQQLTSQVSNLQEKLDYLLSIGQELSRKIEEIKSCEYEYAIISDKVSKIQEIVDKIALQPYSNILFWTKSIDERVEQVLEGRLRWALETWNETFKIGKFKLGTHEFKPSYHEFKIQNQLMFLEPPLEHSRVVWTNNLHHWLSHVCNVKRISSGSFNLSDQSIGTDDTTYRNILFSMKDGLLSKAYNDIHQKIAEASEYVNAWLQYQALWDLESETVSEQLGDKLENWQQVLLEIKKVRVTFDTSGSSKSFQLFDINYDSVQSKVIAKYDVWQKELLLKFAELYASQSSDFHSAVSKNRLNLEQQGSIEGASTLQIVKFVTAVQDVKKLMNTWSCQLEDYRRSQRLLERSRFVFPSEWVYVEAIEGEWQAFMEIYTRKNDLIQQQLDTLKAKILTEDKITSQKSQELADEWDLKKPIQGNLDPNIAIDQLSSYEKRFLKIRENSDLITQAKEALSITSKNDMQLSPLFEELQDLKGVWSTISQIWKSLDEIKETLWSSVVPRKIRQQIENLLSTTKEMPSRMRQYAAYEHLQETLKTYMKMSPLIADLRGEALRDRHWRLLFKRLGIEGKISLSQMSIGDVWGFDLKRNENVIKEVLVVAQGELALEEFLRQIKEYWQNYSVELVNYQNKCRLIKGWDTLFEKCGEHLNSLSAMKMSPYYKEFEEEAEIWFEKLTRIHVIFDIWIDVQRQYVYLEGIFTGNADIKHLLPLESSRFENINNEFMSLMKKVYKSCIVLDIAAIPNVQKSLERLLDLLSRIQKALGEYLGRERSSFPRFYFVGDEDLLEILGNAKDVTRIQKHFKKMFAGLALVRLNDIGDSIIAFESSDGEVVDLIEPIVLSSYPRINEWLGALEKNMRTSLAIWLQRSWEELEQVKLSPAKLTKDFLISWMQKYPAQIVVLAAQILFTSVVEDSLKRKTINQAEGFIQQFLNLLADTVLNNLEYLLRKKCEHLITEMVHQKNVIKNLTQKKIDAVDHFEWLSVMRFYFQDSKEAQNCLRVMMADAAFDYGFEYLSLQERLVNTPLTSRCFLSLTQALKYKYGGSPSGPAGTGKTESVKALGALLGRFVIVFCCDENFDFQAMGRIFIGLCQSGCWGCFDEFNRLEEKILSAVSQQIQTIQEGLRDYEKKKDINILGRALPLHPETAIFVTMNPGYAGRSNLPDNLKRLFRPIAMTKPDRELIAEVLLFTQGFRHAEALSSKIVPLFNLCAEQFSKQPHYDFGLRSLKSVLVSSGILKRRSILSGESSDASSNVKEQQILIQSIKNTLTPKLVGQDVSFLGSLIEGVFPNIPDNPQDLDNLEQAIAQVVDKKSLLNFATWKEKIIQLYQIQSVQHGIMLVGQSGSGKTEAWKTLLAAMELIDDMEGISYVIDPKAISKDDLYGSLDHTTREWQDGLFTHILRKIIDNVRGESLKRHWIVFDGNVDPEWIENLNSLLDDNKILTLPNGERLALPDNVKIMFETETLEYATLATVSRCGMVWFSPDIIAPENRTKSFFHQLQRTLIDVDYGDVQPSEELSTQLLETQKLCADVLLPYTDLTLKCLTLAQNLDHVMDFTDARALETFFSLLHSAIANLLNYNITHTDFPLNFDDLSAYVSKKFILAMLWSFAGDTNLQDRRKLGEQISNMTAIDLPPLSEKETLIDYDVELPSANWTSWSKKVPVVELESRMVVENNVVIPTIDTLRHEDVLYAWLMGHKPVILCGPPGSGKTMCLFSALRKLPDAEVVGLNFSSATTPELLLKTFDQHCEYKKTPAGLTLAPKIQDKWLVLFLDEINLPAPDKYHTQHVISFLRQLIEKNGFWRTSDHSWVQLQRIQFVGAANPPTDPGRVPLSHRFLRHTPIVLVDYPAELSLKQIYGTFIKGVLKLAPSLRGYVEPVTNAMVEFYLKSQEKFTAEQQAHYIYSPRELTRWTRGIFESLKPMDTVCVEDLVRIWAHEALRLFQDRLVEEHERKWTDECLDDVAHKYFHGIDLAKALRRPILFSNWLTKNYVSVEREALKEYLQARLKTFYEEELDVPLVLYDSALEHALRIDRAFRQTQGHVLLIGISGAGKSTLAKFVAWLNGLKVYQINVQYKYSAEDFDEDLKNVLRRAGCKGEKICFLMDESNIMDSGFLERMNTLLANSEVPGLFEGEEYTNLLAQCKESAAKSGIMLDSSDELYKFFTQEISKNLHVVFTMNPPEGGLSSRAAASPALFNRCVLDWFGNWSPTSLYQVALDFTRTLDLTSPAQFLSNGVPDAIIEGIAPPRDFREAVVQSFVLIHQALFAINDKVLKKQDRKNFNTPRHFLDFINHFVRLLMEKREELEDQQRHLNVGLDKIQKTVDDVEVLRQTLNVKKQELESKNALANEKLKKMVEDQQEAEQKRAMSLKIQKQLEKQNTEIEARRQMVLVDLSAAEPAVLEAQKSVSDIKKQHLTEVRSMGNPPGAVKMAMESVCTLLGHQLEGWKTVQQIIRRDDFIANIVNYETEKMMTAEMRDKMNKEYLSNPDFNFETINRASKACGPLALWVIAQVNYSQILDQVGPLRREVEKLELDATEAKKKAEAIEQMIEELEKSISVYKQEYASLIAEVQALKNEMESVQSKVARSVKLLENLSSEKIRWEESSSTFEAQMSTVVGDVFLSAAYMAYAGYFDQSWRAVIFANSKRILNLMKVPFKQSLSLADYLSTLDERSKWQEESLSADTLCMENAVMLKRFNRYPLLIDPSGQALNFLQSHFADRKITITSFLDESFTKHLESALRFGNPLLIQDVDNYDPILNPILNKEFHKTGGRVLVRLGKQEIDFSPSFRLFMLTRDALARFPPDISSRVTFINFTATPASLQLQCLNKILKSERPEIDSKRSDLLKMQGEFQLRLRYLEKALLQALNTTQGNILENDSVMDTLEQLKNEANEITEKISSTDVIMQEVKTVLETYEPLAAASSSIYFSIQQFSMISHFYQFSLEMFLDIFHKILYENENLKRTAQSSERFKILLNDLFYEVLSRCGRTLKQEDRPVLMFLLTRIFLSITSSTSQRLLDLLADDISVLGEDANIPDDLKFFGNEAYTRLKYLLSVEEFQSVSEEFRRKSDCWQKFMVDRHHAQCFLDEITGDKLMQLILVKFLRPDIFSLTVENWCLDTFKFPRDVFNWSLKSITTSELSSSTPLILGCEPGFDASGRVEALANEVNAQLYSVAIGSAEGFAETEKVLLYASKMGAWVLLKNCHLAPSWLNQLEKRLHTLKSNKSFRLFLTMEFHPHIPTSLLRMSRIIVFEAHRGIKNNAYELLKNVPMGLINKPPFERNRLFFLLCWLHAVITERLRYVPVGWTKNYEFNDADLMTALHTVDNWLEAVAQNRSNVSPEKIPWIAIRYFLNNTIYGARLENDFDKVLLNTLVNRIVTPAAYELNYSFADDKPIPDGNHLDQFLNWVKQLPDNQSPTWIGLPTDVENIILTNQGYALGKKLLQFKNVSITDISDIKKTGDDSGRPQWINDIIQTAFEWKKCLAELSCTRKNLDLDDPIERYLFRETRVATDLLSRVQHDLSLLLDYGENRIHMTNQIQDLLQSIKVSSVPLSWRGFSYGSSTTIDKWMNGFQQRLKHLSSVDPLSGSVWFGGFMKPEAFVTATRQYVAKKNSWSLESLQMELLLDNTTSTSELFHLQQIALIGATLQSGNLVPSDKANNIVILDNVYIRWFKKSESTVKSAPNTILVPFYLNEDRDTLVTAVEMPYSGGDYAKFYQHGIALIADATNYQ